MGAEMDATEFARSQIRQICERIALTTIEQELIEATLAYAYQAGIVEGATQAQTRIKTAFEAQRQS
jgi:hypothetical protein